MNFLILGLLAMVFINTKTLPNIVKNTQFDAHFEQYGRKYNIAPSILKAMAFVESSLNPVAKNPQSSALGLMQVTKAAAEQVGESYAKQTDPETAIRTGAKYIAWLKSVYGFNTMDAIRAYYAGAGTIRLGDANLSFPHEWQSEAYRYADVYLKKVLSAQTSLAVS